MPGLFFCGKNCRCLAREIFRAVRTKTFSTHTMRMENVLVRTPWKETWLELERPGVETTKGWKVRRESDGKRVGRGWRVCLDQMCDCPGWELWGWEQGKTRVRAREEPMVRWRRGISRPCPASHRHGTATPGVHMGIIVKFSEALPCVKSPVSRTSGPIYVVT